MLDEAIGFLGSFPWVGRILESYYGIAVGGVVAVFLFHVVPARDGVDEWLWVVVGDLPPAYLVTDDAPTPAPALRAGDALDDVIPVKAPADLAACRHAREPAGVPRSEGDGRGEPAVARPASAAGRSG